MIACLLACWNLVISGGKGVMAVVNHGCLLEDF
jgi:hypothetical protein